MPLLDLSGFKKAVDAFTRTYHVACDLKNLQSFSPAIQEALKAGLIQNFEFTYEIAWKFLKRWLEQNYSYQEIDGVTRRELFRLAAEHQLITDVELWMQFHRARNLTSHTYEAKTAEEVYQFAIQFLPIVKQLYDKLSQKND